MSNKQIKTEPQGLISHKLWMETRLVDIRQAIERYNIAGKECPRVWKTEHDNLVNEIGAE